MIEFYCFLPARIQRLAWRAALRCGLYRLAYDMADHAHHAQCDVMLIVTDVVWRNANARGE